MKELVLLASILALVAGQAPGDEDELCTVTLPSLNPPQNVFMDPPNVVPLMDSSHYTRLLPPNPNPVWQRVDMDDNNLAGQGTTWTEQGAECVSGVTACGYDEGAQENWLITQHITTTLKNSVRLLRVTLQVDYLQSMCPTTGANVCQRVFDVRKFQTSSINATAARESTNYVPVDRLTTFEASEEQTQFVDIDLDDSESGLYLAIIDPGTCIIINRLLVFYRVCLTETVNLVAYPRTLAGRAPLQVTAGCVENASPKSGAITLTCLSDGTWVNSTSRCKCDSGFVPSGERCVACDAGMYASAVLEECVVCPNNSNSTEPGLSECPCDEGYYRTPQEIDMPCTLPPGPPGNVTIVNMTTTSITLSWDAPLSTGGRNRSELRYNLWYRVSGDTEIRLSKTVYTTIGEITELSPNVRYDVFVSSETDITGQINMTLDLLLERGVMLLETTPPDSSPSSLGTGVIAAIVIIVVLVIAGLLAALLVVFLCYLKQKKVVKKTISAYANPIELPQKGHRMYVDPTTYASPDEAIRDFATEIPPRDIRLLEEIGAGEFGNVYKGVWKKEGKQIPIAVKTLRSGSSAKARNDFLTEASIMGQFDHPHVIKLYGVVTRVEPVMIVMEFMENGSLYHYLRKHDDRLSVERQVKMARSVASGMDYLSTVGFVHRDLAARNILVAKDEVCKVADFGLSRETVDDEYDVKKGGKIPVRWTAPEAIFKRRFTSASDVWSYGILLWEIMSYGQHPYEAEDWDNQTVLDRVETGYRLEKPDGCPQSVYQLMLNCWHAEKKDRPSFTEIVLYIDKLLENKMQVDLPNPAPAKKVPKTYLTSAHILNPLDYNSLEEWLVAIKMERYKDKFEQNGYKDINQILRLTEADLRAMGITLSGHLYRITTSIEKAQTQVSRQPSLKV